MKFLAMLKDSLREAIDAKVFYVMVGLSLLATLVAASVTFTPKPGARMLMEAAVLPLSVDLSSPDLPFLHPPGGMEELEPPEAMGDDGPRRGPSRPRGPMGKMGWLRGGFQLVNAEPEGGQADLPGSTFEATVRDSAAGIPGLGLLLGEGKEKTLAKIRERFGVIGDVRIAELIEASPGPEANTYRLRARITPAGRRLWPHEMSLFFGGWTIIPQGVPLGMQVYVLQEAVINWVGAWVALLTSVLLTAFFVPNMLRKGTIDMLLVKPISRPVLLVYKYIGGLLFILLNTAVAVLGIWMALNLRSGLWGQGALVSIPAITFFFAILYSVSVLAGVVTRSPVVCILLTMITWVGLFVVGAMNSAMSSQVAARKAMVRANHASAARMAATLAGLGAAPLPHLAVAPAADRLSSMGPLEDEPTLFERGVKAVHFVLPRTSDLTALISRYLQEDLSGIPMVEQAKAMQAPAVPLAETIGVSLAFIGVMLGLACWWFSTKDY